MEQIRLSVALTASLFASACACAGPAPAPAKPPRLPEVVAGADAHSLFVLADPQLHNVYGGSVKQMLPAADVVSKVAIRPPELNLLAPLALEELLKEGQAQFRKPNPLVVVLGDATNVACTGEWDLLVRAFENGAPGAVWLMAHGNHDSYLMGTANHYLPGDANQIARRDTTLVPRMATEVLPPDEAWWDELAAPISADWASGCYIHKGSAGAASTPMNKVRWLARYLNQLKAHGLNLRAPATAGGERVVPIAAAVKPGSLLADMNYRVAGSWVRPYRDPAKGWQWLDTWKSFVVQAVDVGPKHTLVLIDTSLCITEGYFAFYKTNAGSRGCIGQDQFKAIERILDTTANRHVVFAGHFPLEDLSGPERTELVRIMRARAGAAPWSYLSAHTHERISMREGDGGRDINIGSTTDWPMEAHVLSLDPSSPTVRATNPVRVPSYAVIDFNPIRSSMRASTPELCRHVIAAERLASLEPADVADEPWSESTTDAQCMSALSKAQDAYEAHRKRDTPASTAKLQLAVADIATYSARLHAALEKINQKFRDDLGYRRLMLSIAAAASRSDFISWDLLQLRELIQ